MISIAGTKDMIIDNGILMDSSGKEHTSGNVDVVLYGIKSTVTVEWLKLYGEYISEFMDDFGKHAFDIEFYKHNRNHKYVAYTIRFKKPVEVGNGFRLIARYPKYAINKAGDILSSSTGKIRRLKDVLKNKSNNDYPHIYVYDYRMGYSVKAYIHILYATAFVDNDDWDNKTIVNHENGDKYDVREDNFKWVTPSENTQHYYDVLVGKENYSDNTVFF